MKKILFSVVLCIFPYMAHGNIFTQTVIQDINFQYVLYDISSQKYNIKTAISSTPVTWAELAEKYNALTAINGVFFCPEDYANCDGWNYTINERFIEWKDLSFYPDTGERGIFWWDINGTPLLHQTGRINPNIRWDIYEWLGNFPILLSDWEIMLQRYHDIWLYDSKMSASLSRHFICSDSLNNYIIFWRTSGVSLDTLVPALQELWCWNAMNLDAGNSSHFVYNNRALVTGKRKIIDGFVIERIGLDTSLLNTQIAKAKDLVRSKLASYPKPTTISQLDTLITYIQGLRHDMYVQRSVDIYDDFWNNIGYQIQADDIPSLKYLYLINGLERSMRELRWEIQNS